MDLGLIGGAYAGRARAQNVQICVNWMVETDNTEANTRTLVSTPGLTPPFADLGASPIRGMYGYNGKLYATSANKMFEISAAGVPTQIGTLFTSSGPMSFSDNGASKGKQLVACDGVDMYIYDTTGAPTFGVNGDVDFEGAKIVDFIDGFLVYMREGSQKLYLSALNDASAVFGFGEAEGSPDSLVSLLVDHREVWLFGSLTTEVFFNSGDADFPLRRFQGGFTHQGCAAAFSPGRIDNTIMWLSQNDRGEGQIVQAGEGYRARVISPQQINHTISGFSRISDAVAYTYQDEGHEFYVLSFPTGNATIVYDAKEKEWHTRASQFGDGNNQRQRVQSHAHVYGKHLVGSHIDGKIYELSTAAGRENTDFVLRERIGPHVQNEHQNIVFNEVEAVFEHAANAVVELRYSKDKGNTWSQWRGRSLGAVGNQGARTVWRKLGRARDWVFHVRTAADTPMVLVGAYGR